MRNQLLLTILILGSYVAFSREISDLNSVLNYVIGEMNKASFFKKTWEKYYVGINWVPVPEECDVYGAQVVTLSDADSSLSSVIDRGFLRIGIHKSAGSIPSLYSISNGAENPTKDLSSEPYDGYEIASANMAVQRLGIIYGVNLTAEFIVVEGDDYFDSLRDKLNEGTIDVVWSSMTVNEDRAKEVAFTCPSFASQYVIAASPEAGSALPPSSGAEVPVACFAVFCDLIFPPPFIPVELEGDRNSLQGQKEVLINPNDEFNYTVMNFEDLRLFFQESCENCSIPTMKPLRYSYQAPSTRRLNITSNSTTSEDTSSASSKCAAQLFFAASLFLCFIYS